MSNDMFLDISLECLVLNEYEKPPIDPAIEEELEAYVTKRKEQILT